jgi:hypothetical protein
LRIPGKLFLNPGSDALPPSEGPVVRKQFCYGVFVLLLLLPVIAVYLWATFASLLEEDTAYLYNPVTTEIFAIGMTNKTSSIQLSGLLNPFAQARRRVPNVGIYLGHLNELRERINRYKADSDNFGSESMEESTDLVSLEYFPVGDQQLVGDFIPDEWQGLAIPDDKNDDIILANVVIIKENWPDGLLGDAVWPVDVSLISNVRIFFGRSANELCVREMARDSPRWEGIVREIGCFFP